MEVEGGVVAMEDEFSQGAAHPQSMHEPVSREPAGDEEVLDVAGPVADDQVAVEAVLVVQPRPRLLQRQLAAAPKTVGERRSHGLVVVPVVNCEVLPARVVEVHQPYRYAPGGRRVQPRP